MKYLNMKISREQLDRKLEPLRDLAVSGMPKQGWIRTIRDALGMSSAQLGKKAGLGQPRISRLEHAEKTGDLKVSSLQKIANAFGMRLYTVLFQRLLWSTWSASRLKRLFSAEWSAWTEL